MADEATDVNDEQAVDAQAAEATDQQGAGTKDQQGVKDAQAASEQGVTDQVASDEHAVPYTRFTEVNEAKKKAEEEAATLRAQLQLLSQQQQVPQQSKSLYDQTVERLGLQDETYLNKDQQGQVFNAMFEVISASQTETQFMASHPDYPQVVGSYNQAGQFVPAPPLLRALEKDPTLGPQLGAIPEMQRKAFAYRLAVNDPEYQASLKTKDNPALRQAADAKTVAEAAKKQASISAAGSGQGTLDKKAVVQNMTDEQFDAHIKAIIARAG